jgi:hypothetical protein
VIDALAAMRTLLLADPAITDLCEIRVFAGELPQGEVKDMPRKCIVIVASGGMERTATDPLIRPRFDLYAYAETYYEAGRVDRAIYDTLKTLQRQRVGDALLHSVALSGGPMQVRDPDNGWPIMWRSVSVTADEREIE